MSFEFGDRILYNGRPAVFLHYQSEETGKDCWISWHGEGTSFCTYETWVSADEIILADSVCAAPINPSNKIRDSLVFMHGQLNALMLLSEPATSDMIELVSRQCNRALKDLFPGYGVITD